MSIIGEMYDEQIWQYRTELRKRMEEYLASIQDQINITLLGCSCLGYVRDEFKKKFEPELKYGTP